MESLSAATFERNYPLHLQHLKLKGLQPKTIDAYALAIRRIGKRFDHQIDNLSEPRINDQVRVCFRWTVAGAEDVEIVDYH
mgnify:CR=1 FL=1